MTPQAAVMGWVSREQIGGNDINSRLREPGTAPELPESQRPTGGVRVGCGSMTKHPAGDIPRYY